MQPEMRAETVPKEMTHPYLFYMQKDKLKDSALIYSKDIFLWYNQIPSSMNAQSYSDPAKIMTAIRQYSNEPGFSQPVDRWSFAVAQKEWEDICRAPAVNRLRKTGLVAVLTDCSHNFRRIGIRLRIH